MAAREDADPVSTWLDDDQDDLTEMEMEMDDDSDLYLDDDMESDDDDLEIDVDDDEVDSRLTRLVDRYQAFSARRRIEIAREDKWLKSVMADFDDYDSFEDQNGGNLTEGFSY